MIFLAKLFKEGRGEVRKREREGIGKPYCRIAGWEGAGEGVGGEGGLETEIAVPQCSTTLSKITTALLN